MDKNTYLAELYRDRTDLRAELRGAENPRHREVIEVQIKALDDLIERVESSDE